MTRLNRRLPKKKNNIKENGLERKKQMYSILGTTIDKIKMAIKTASLTVLGEHVSCYRQKIYMKHEQTTNTNNNKGLRAGRPKAHGA